jgi:hypothetical protein
MTDNGNVVHMFRRSECELEETKSLLSGGIVGPREFVEVAFRPIKTRRKTQRLRKHEKILPNKIDSGLLSNPMVFTI